MTESYEKFMLKPYAFDGLDEKLKDAPAGALDELGIAVNDQIAMDALPNMITAASAMTPVQMLQAWDPSIIRVALAPMKADEAFGRRIIGDWEDEEIVTTVLENVGQAQLYGDTANVPFAEINVNFEKRKIQRFELGMLVSHLEEKRYAKMRVSAEGEKRESIVRALSVALNDIAFNGFNDGHGETYGILNDPNKPAYTSAAKAFDSCTYAEAVAQFQAAFSALIAKSNGKVDPEKDSITVLLPPSVKPYLTTPTSQLGATVIKWLNENYPKTRLVFCPQMTAANGGENVMFMFADEIDGMQVVNQNVQSPLYFLGFERKAKGQIEDYSAATAGVMIRVPMALVCYTGV